MSVNARCISIQQAPLWTRLSMPPLDITTAASQHEHKHNSYNDCINSSSNNNNIINIINIININKNSSTTNNNGSCNNCKNHLKARQQQLLHDHYTRSTTMGDPCTRYLDARA